MSLPERNRQTFASFLPMMAFNSPVDFISETRVSAPGVGSAVTAYQTKRADDFITTFCKKS